MSPFLPESEATPLRERFEAVRERLFLATAASGRKPGDVRLIAISKTQPPSVVAALANYWNGAEAVFGENYVQEALIKQSEVASLLLRESGNSALLPDWHFTGHIQSRKAKEVAGRFSLIHTLDSEKLARQIAKNVREGKLPKQKVLIQVNIGEEPQKNGVLPSETSLLANNILAMEEIELCGLMCLPPNFDAPESSRPFFARLRELRERLQKDCGVSLPHLSMGMSHDFEVAVEEGATLVRIGTDIFGNRPAKL